MNTNTCDFCSRFLNAVYSELDTSHLLQLGVKHYNALYECPLCKQLWLESVYEPAQYNYFIRWNHTNEKWEELNSSREKYKIFSLWVDCTIYEYYKSGNAPKDFMKYVERHRERSYFNYNPIDSVEKDKPTKPTL